ncbi:MAG: LacI family DNA-binding transcriptional regulator, partial [Formivibrio sp.]|nr:LacI family DNA-binding transcriptional regulator [Formivibrio sp.]
MTVTVREIAKKARVSLGTVSNVLNRRQTVKPQIQARVEAAINELGYIPGQNAHGALRKTTPTLVFLLGNRELSDPFHSRVLKGVSRQCEPIGALVLFAQLF